MHWVDAVLLAVGWVFTVALACWLTSAIQRRRHVCPVDPPTKAVLVNAAGLPESVRSLKGAAPETYSRPKGKDPAIIYHRIGTAALYQPKA